MDNEKKSAKPTSYSTHLNPLPEILDLPGVDVNGRSFGVFGLQLAHP